jgi:hypothetical protein
MTVLPLDQLVYVRANGLYLARIDAPGPRPDVWVRHPREAATFDRDLVESSVHGSYEMLPAEEV